MQFEFLPMYPVSRTTIYISCEKCHNLGGYNHQMAMSALVLLRNVVDSNYFGFLNLLLNPLYWQSLVGIGEIACSTLAWSYRGLILNT